MDWVVTGGLVATALFAIALFNFVIVRKSHVELASGSIHTQLRKRCDLVPLVVSLCENYMGREERLLEDLTETRARILRGAGDKAALHDELSARLRSVVALAETYPALKDLESFTLLRRSLNEIEERLSASRRTFRAALAAYNNTVGTFPTSVVARMVGCGRRAPLESVPGERQPVRLRR